MGFRRCIIAVLAASIGLFAPQLKAESIKQVRIPLYFKVDKYEHDTENISNTASIDSLFRFIGRTGFAKLRSIDITGYSSPEGADEHNVQLGAKRAKYVENLIGERFPELQGRIVTRSGGEAWEMLKGRIQKDRFLTRATRDRVVAIIDAEGIAPDTREWRLVNKVGTDPMIGQVWPHIFNRHFPQLRCSIVILEIDEDAVEEEEPAAEPVVAEPVVAEPVVAEPVVAEPVVAEPVADKSLETSDLSSSVLPEKAQVDTTQVADSLAVSRQLDTMVGDGNRFKTRQPCKPLLGVSTNLIYDATFIPHYGFTSVPSFSIEYYPDRGNWTFGADVDWSHWLHYEDHRFNQIHNITLNARRYFKSGEDSFKGLYLLGNINTVQYGLGWDAKGWEGEAVGLSAGIGNKWRFARIYIDVGVCVGALYSRFDPYVWGNDATKWYYYDYIGKPEDFRERSKSLLWLGPTRAWISIGFDLLMRKKK